MTGIFKVEEHGLDNYTAYDFMKSLERKIEKELEALNRHVVGGNLETFESYKHKTGIIKGLNDVKQMINDLKRSGK